MKRRRTNQIKPRHQRFDEILRAKLPALPLEAGHWHAVIAEMNLAPREAQVAELMVCGGTVQQVAAVLGIGTSTVRTNQTRICAKSRIHSHEFFVHVLRISHEVRQCKCSPK